MDENQCSVDGIKTANSINTSSLQSTTALQAILRINPILCCARHLSETAFY